MVYLCEHTEDGAMGLIINQQMDIPINAIFKQMDLIYNEDCVETFIFDGGLHPPPLRRCSCHRSLRSAHEEPMLLGWHAMLDFQTPFHIVASAGSAHRQDAEQAA